MNTMIKMMSAAALVAASGVPIAAPADAHASRYRHHHYHGRTVYAYRACRHSSGTTGLIAGGAAGAIVGSQVIGGGILGTAAGAVGGALAGRAVDRTMTAPRRCRVYR
jgi:outer membrane lipoprotein SlyB